jgi:hypothetical protein
MRFYLQMRTKFSIFIFLFVPLQLFCQPPNGSQDPLGGMIYRNAFQQKDLYLEFEDVLRDLESKGNTPSVARVARKKPPHQAIVMAGPAHNEFCLNGYCIDIDVPSSKSRLENRAIEYKKACLQRLYDERRRTILQPAKVNLSLIALVMGSMGISVEMLGMNDSMGGSFSIFAALINTAFLMKEVIDSGFNLANPPDHPLNTLEEEYAIWKHTIPHQTWPMVEEKFMTARQNPFAQREAIDFIQFALGFKSFIPKTPLSNTQIQTMIHRVNARIDSFFDQYEKFDQEPKGLIKLRVGQFLLALEDPKQGPARGLHLYGPPGVGKTHFARSLKEWINEASQDNFLESISGFENIVVSSPEELEGSPNSPSVFLRLLRSQITKKTRGTVVLMDEAEWLNDPTMKAPAKRVFNNGDLSTIQTDYFGNGEDGTGISLPMYPMLLIAASNQKIEDDALASRFDCVDFPNPTPHALLEHAQDVASKSAMLQLMRRYRTSSQENIDAWLKKKNVKNFREIDAGLKNGLLLIE